MRYKIPVIVIRILAAACLALLPACATCRKSNARLTIINASYGAAGHRIDVTDAVRPLVTGNAICLRAPWALGQVDPAFGRLKDVRIVYRLGGSQHSAVFTQQQDIVLPESPVSLVIVDNEDVNAGGIDQSSPQPPPGKGKNDFQNWLSEQPAAQFNTGGMKYEFHTWHQGQPPVRLIRMEDGFCALTRVTGHFEGGGEVAQVYIGPDGYWYLGGHSMQKGVAAQCIVVHYR